MTDHSVMRNVHTEEGGARVERGWHFPACTANACNGGRKPCPCPDACQIPQDEDGPGLLASAWFWLCGGLTGAFSLAVWAFLIANGWL